MLLGLACSAGASGSQDRPRVSVKTLPVHYDIDTSRSWRQLSEENDAPYTVGLVRAVFHVDVRAQDTGDFVVEVGYRPMTLRLARELRGNSCLEAHFLAHELEHVSLYAEHLDVVPQRLLPRLEALLQEGLSTDSLVRSARQIALDELGAVMPRHRALDSSAEYAANAKACNGAALRLLGRR